MKTHPGTETGDGKSLTLSKLSFTYTTHPARLVHLRIAPKRQVQPNRILNATASAGGLKVVDKLGVMYYLY